ncbi:MAG: ABC transporter ATP-binding protein [Ignavibacteriaceae bacterium]|mgnify:CR=1 FL=1|jgi:ATP-binding cassette subfamily B protein|nr:MAG: ABC transporter ATP-binding protein [Chlorobiota bacterium]KXK04983.1 MAG: ABC-type multidrug transport system protein [Chlorobi bacterium OLB4]MBV6397797.1 putative ABC transporter ATP-binding protein [Ignavibacteria bacterium]MCC6885574.1 ABC transporter ATP-binding protein [Ignavibacteriales bacterium]MCE7952928.1 ABC transporter ATP-binding protein [Chlorobi bacterium CHB7]MDL1886909.1 ABC transporter ATP-binding protein [Ignavibacteria bacterium CHB1]MEB2328678.1 ABC transporter 
MENVKKLFQLLDKWKHNYVFASVLLIIATAIRMLEPKVLQVTVDKIVAYFTVSSDSYKGGTGMITTLFNSMLPELRTDNLHIILIWLGLIFLFISLLRGVFTFSSSAISASSTEKAIKKLRDRLFSHLQALPLAYHSKTPTGELIQRCTGDVETVRKFASIQVVDVLRLLTIFIAAFIMMYGINIIYSLIAVALVPVIAVGSVIFFKKESEIWTKHEKEQDKLSIIVQENLSGIRVVKAFAKEKYEIEKFTNQNETKRQWGIKLLKLHAFFWPFSDFLVYTQMSISVFAGAYFALNGVITVGELTAFYSYAMLVTWPLRRVGQVVAEMGMTTVAIKRIFSILDFQAEDRTGINENGYGKLKGEIEFRNISFRYPDGNEKHVLNDISFKIKPGEKIALLGPSGSGKSTIISLLMRFFEPDEGEILLDGKSLKLYSKELLRNRIGVVLQKPFLFSRTLKENIAYGNPSSHIDEVIDAAKAAKIHDVITEIFPQSYETVVGEKGVTLSGGQKQRVSIARTLLTDPDIFVLDDSTSAVDTETEFEIQKALAEIMKNKTSFVIAHRITSIQNCDRIIVLDKGKVIEQGTQKDLLSIDGFFKKIYNLQVLIEEEIENEIKQG